MDELDRRDMPSILLGFVDQLPSSATEVRMRSESMSWPSMQPGNAKATSVEEFVQWCARRRQWENDSYTPVVVGSASNIANDSAFRIVRVRGDALRILVSSTGVLLHALLELRPDPADESLFEYWLGCVNTHLLLLCYLGGADSVPETLSPSDFDGRAPAAGRDPLRQWILGHRSFMTFCQGLVIALRSARAAFDTDDDRARDLGIDAVVRLLDGCAVAMQFAASYRQEMYAEIIRPTVMPPVAPPAMSGLHWRDHEALVEELNLCSGMWSLLSEVAERSAAVCTVRQSLVAVYDSHIGVCARFVGSEAPSLLGRGSSPRTAVEVLGQLRARRASSFDGEPT